MPFARKNLVVADESGNIQDGCSIEVRRQAAGLPLVQLYSDREGQVAIGNPFTAADGADAGFHAAGGSYQITASKLGFSRTWNYEPIGLASESDTVPEVGVLLTWDDGTADADPGSGEIRANNASLASATLLFISKTNRSADDISAFLAALDDSDNTSDKGTMTLTSDAGTSQAIFAVGAVTDASGYIKLAVSGHSGVTAFNAGALISLGFSRTGNRGAVGPQGGLKYSFNSATSGDPGTGKFLFNHATFGSATVFHISETDGDSNGLAAVLAAIDGGTSTNKLLVHAIKDGGVGIFSFYITAALSDIGAYDTFPITPISTSGSISNNDTFRLLFIPVGDKGDTGPQGTQGDTGPSGADGSDPGILLTWDTSTTDADPGNGNIRANNANLSSATVLYVDDLSRAGSNIEAFILSLDDSTNTVKGVLVLTRTSDDVQVVYNITGAVTDASGYTKVAVTYVSGATSFSAADPISLQFSRAGDTAGAATETTAGIVELATDGETQTGTDTARAITPANLTAKEATVANWRANDADRLLTTDIVWSAMAEVSLIDGANIAVDFDSGFDFTVTLGGNRALSNGSNLKVGQKGRFRIVQDGTGTRTLSYGTDYEFTGGTAIVLSTAISAQDVIYYDIIAAGRVLLTMGGRAIA